MGILGALAVAIVNSLRSPSSAGGPLTQDDITAFLTDVVSGFHVVDAEFTLADALLAIAGVEATSAGNAISEIGNDFKFVTEHTYKVVIPGSLSWLRGYMILHIIDPMRADIRKLQQSVAFLMGWRGQIDNWRHNWVDPNIGAWRAFHTWFDGWPTATLNTVHDWLQHPAHFSDFATPIVARPLVDYYASKDHKPLRDYLTQTIIDATPDKYRYAVAAFETMLDEPWP